jgi:hypothetical protein
VDVYVSEVVERGFEQVVRVKQVLRVKLDLEQVRLSGN